MKYISLIAFSLCCIKIININAGAIAAKTGTIVAKGGTLFAKKLGADTAKQLKEANDREEQFRQAGLLRLRYRAEYPARLLGEEHLDELRIAVGAVYRIFTLCLSTISQKRPASGQVGIPSNIREVAPAQSGPLRWLRWPRSRSTSSTYRRPERSIESAKPGTGAYPPMPRRVPSTCFYPTTRSVARPTIPSMVPSTSAPRRFDQPATMSTYGAVCAIMTCKWYRPTTARFA